jgi:hypothetical protein
MKSDTLLVKSKKDIQGLGNGLYFTIVDPNAIEIVPTAYPGFIVLVGENVISASCECFRQKKTYGLHSLSGFAPNHDVEIHLATFLLTLSSCSRYLIFLIKEVIIENLQF